MQRFDYEMVDRERVKEALPQIGPEVVGASYSRFDGHCNSLQALSRAQHRHAAARRHLYARAPRRDASRTRAASSGLRRPKAKCARRRSCSRPASTTAGSARWWGSNVPVRPQRGQIIVTEKAAPFMHYHRPEPAPDRRRRHHDRRFGGRGGRRSDRDARRSSRCSPIARSRKFPLVAKLNVVRTWAALRVMTKDGFPIYDESHALSGRVLGVVPQRRHALRRACALPRAADRGRPSARRTISRLSARDDSMFKRLAA